MFELVVYLVIMGYSESRVERRVMVKDLLWTECVHLKHQSEFTQPMRKNVIAYGFHCEDQDEEP